MAVRVKRPTMVRPSAPKAPKTVRARPTAIAKPAVRRPPVSVRAAGAAPAAAGRGVTVRASAMAAPSITTGETNPNGPNNGNNGARRGAKLQSRAEKRVKKLSTAKGKTLTDEQIKKKAAYHIRMDRGSGAAVFDWARDGSKNKDRDFGTKENNKLRAKRGKERANVKGDTKYGTGKKLKKSSGGGGNGGGGGGGNGGGNGGGGNGGIGDPFPNGNNDGDPNNSSAPVDLSPQSTINPRTGEVPSSDSTSRSRQGLLTAEEKRRRRLTRERRNENK